MASLAKIKPKKIYISGVFGRDVNFTQQNKRTPGDRGLVNIQ